MKNEMAKLIVSIFDGTCNQELLRIDYTEYCYAIKCFENEIATFENAGCIRLDAGYSETECYQRLKNERGHFLTVTLLN